MLENFELMQCQNGTNSAHTVVQQAEDVIHYMGGDIGMFLFPTRYSTCGVIAIPVDQLKGRRQQAIEYTVRIAVKGATRLYQYWKKQEFTKWADT